MCAYKETILGINRLYEGEPVSFVVSMVLDRGISQIGT